MFVAQDFIKKLQDVTEQNFWVSPPENVTFQDVLTQYENYYKNLDNHETREKLSNFFWDQVKEIGTPIIENRLDETKCNVYFIYGNSNAQHDKNLYLQGTFHGYGGENKKNTLASLANSDILFRCDIIDTNSVITYNYIENDLINNKVLNLNDNYSDHRNEYNGFSKTGLIFKVNPDQKQAHLGVRENENYWERIMSPSKASKNHFIFTETIYSDSQNKLHSCNEPVPENVDIYNPAADNLDKLSGSPYANFTHAVHIFKPTSERIENVVVVNDGRPYLLAGFMEKMEQMVNSNNLPMNTAFIFIDPLQGLLKVMPEIANDETFKMNGMGVRVIDFEKKVANYSIFLKDLLNQLCVNEAQIPCHTSHRVIIGSSLSGTANLYIGSEKQNLFHAIIAQSPSPSNEKILTNMRINPEVNIHLSCGIYEQPLYNGVETNGYGFAKTLEKKLGLTLHEGHYGHNHASWVSELTHSLPQALSHDYAAWRCDIATAEMDVALTAKLCKLPQWQSDLINQVFNAMKDYYCLPQKLSGSNKYEFKNSLIETFEKINAENNENLRLIQELSSSINEDKENRDEPITYNKPTSQEGYAVYLNAINKTLENFDSHLHLQYNHTFIAERKDDEIVKGVNSARFNFGSGPPQEVLLEMNTFRSKPEINYGFISQPKKGTVPDDIGYIKIDCLLDPSLGAEEKEEKYRVGPNAIKAANEAMQKLVGKKGIIIDLRDAEEGGSPEMVQYLISSFIKQKGEVINEVENRFTNPLPPHRTTYKVIDTPYLFDVPVTILTDKTTFSAREEIAYDLQQLNIHLQQIGEQDGDRFKVIGEVSKGGAHPTRSFPLMNSSRDINPDIIVWMPDSESINPTSKKNWEKTGVKPDIPIKSGEDALEVAVGHLRSLIPEPPKIASNNKFEEKEATANGSYHLITKRIAISPPLKHSAQSELVNHRYAEVEKSKSHESKKHDGVDITDEEMAKSAFGQGSNTVREFKK